MVVLITKLGVGVCYGDSSRDMHAGKGWTVMLQTSRGWEVHRPAGGRASFSPIVRVPTPKVWLRGATMISDGQIGDAQDPPRRPASRQNTSLTASRAITVFLCNAS